jgi:hypothetical protein
MYRLSLWFTRFYVLSFDCCAYSLLSISMLFHVSGSEFMHTLILYGLLAIWNFLIFWLFQVTMHMLTAGLLATCLVFRLLWRLYFYILSAVRRLSGFMHGLVRGVNHEEKELRWIAAGVSPVTGALSTLGEITRWGFMYVEASIGIGWKLETCIIDESVWSAAWSTDLEEWGRRRGDQRYVRPQKLSFHYPNISLKKNFNGLESLKMTTNLLQLTFKKLVPYYNSNWCRI